MEGKPSLNALRAFDAVVRLGGLSRAAEELSVTPSAVSHQVAQLERDLGLALLERNGNRVSATVEGVRFAQRIGPALAALKSAVRDTRRDAATVSVKAGVSIVARLLIPMLQSFREEHPRIQVQIETSHFGHIEMGPSLDVILTYRRGAADPESVLPDWVIPMAAPGLLSRLERKAVTDMPLLSCSEHDWDWHVWAKARGIDPASLSISDRFDTDDAAVLATAAGLGVCLVPVAFARREIDLGLLQPIPREPAMVMGHYALVVNEYANAPSRRFATWLRTALAKEAASMNAEGWT